MLTSGVRRYIDTWISIQPSISSGEILRLLASELNIAADSKTVSYVLERTIR